MEMEEEEGFGVCCLVRQLRLGPENPDPAGLNLDSGYSLWHCSSSPRHQHFRGAFHGKLAWEKN